jgi:predicted O-methyltransferase YrrM
MADETPWSAVDRYITDHLIPADPALDAALSASAAAGLPAISVSPAQGKMLHLLAAIRGARNILEIGTLGAYSTIWLARALPPGGRLVTLEMNPGHAELARANLEGAGLQDVADVRLGPALETLPALEREGKGPFDFVFIDADKASIPAYFSWAIRLGRVGTVIVVDNVIRKGALIDPSNQDPNVVGVRRFHEALAAEPRVSATTVQTVGSKGYDGFTLAVIQR